MTVYARVPYLFKMSQWAKLTTVSTTLGLLWLIWIVCGAIIIIVIGRICLFLWPGHINWVSKSREMAHGSKYQYQDWSLLNVRVNFMTQHDLVRNPRIVNLPDYGFHRMFEASSEKKIIHFHFPSRAIFIYLYVQKLICKEDHHWQVILELRCNVSLQGSLKHTSREIQRLRITTEALTFPPYRGICFHSMVKNFLWLLILLLPLLFLSPPIQERYICQKPKKLSLLMTEPLPGETVHFS